MEAGPGPPDKDTAAPPAAEGTTAPATAAKHLTADQVAEALKTRGLPVTGVVVYNENNDPNQKLGRLGQYTSKVNFADTRAKSTREQGGNDVKDGGSVEVFENQADALARGVYIQTIGQSMPILGTEYNYIAGGVLLRLSGNLTPSQTCQYEAAPRNIVGQPIVTPKPAHT